MQMQRLRRLALHVLLAWLFAFGTGVVNACVVQAHVRSASLAAAAQQAQAQMQAQDAADAPCVHEGGGGADHSKLPCERFCEEPGAVAQAAKQQSDVTGGFLLAAAPPASFQFQSWTQPDSTPASAPAPWRAAIPIPIAFLRLAL